MAGTSIDDLCKGGPYGSASKRRIIPMSARVQPILEASFSINKTFGWSVRTIQRVLKMVANRARIRRNVTPHGFPTVTDIALKIGAGRQQARTYFHSSINFLQGHPSIYFPIEPDTSL